MRGSCPNFFAPNLIDLTWGELTMEAGSGYTTTVQRMTAGTAINPNVPITNYQPLPPTTPPNHVGEELKWLDNELATLHEQVRLLAGKLEPVMTPPTPEGDTGGKNMGCASPLVKKLRDQRCSLTSATNALAHIIGRVEL